MKNTGYLADKRQYKEIILGWKGLGMNWDRTNQIYGSEH